MTISARRLRRGARREAIGVDIRAAVALVGTLLKYLSLAYLFPVAIAIGYDEPVWPFVGAGAAVGLTGLGLERLSRKDSRVGPREGFLVVSLVWLLAAGAGAIPYLLSGEEQLGHPLDAYFESMSGFTTTGASVLTDIEALNHSLLMWRQLTTWIGGMGIIVLALAVLPRLRVGGRQLFESESPGPDVEPLAVTIRVAARRFLVLYVALTGLEVAVLTGIGWTGLDEKMGPYEALAHSFATLATAGFSTRARSFEEFGAATQWAVTAFMVIAGTNFALLYVSILRRRIGRLLRDEEFRLYFALLAVSTLVVTLELVSEGIERGEAALRHAAFQVASIGTTTGFASADFNKWTAATWIVLVGLMLVGASAGSTSGSVKTIRHVMIGKILWRELDQTVHPELVAPIELNGRRVDERTLRAVIAFVLIYVGVVALGAVVVSFDSARLDLAVSPFDAIAASATTLGNVGPGLGIAGPMGSFDPFGEVSKLVLVVLMWIGRLELIPVLVLLTRNYWRA